MEYNGRLVDVEPFVQHDGVADTWERYATGFVMLGRFHQALEPFSMQLIQTPPLVSNYGTPEQLIGWTRHARDQIESATPTAAAALAVCDQALALLDLLQEGWKDTPPLLHTGTHGDYGGENVLFRREQIVAILDFDFLGIRERVFDLAYSLYWMFRRLQPRVAPDYWDWQQMQRMITAYNAAHPQPLAPEEQQALPLTMACVPLYWVAEAGWLSDPVHTVLQWADQLHIARWLAQHADRVQAFLAARTR